MKRIVLLIFVLFIPILNAGETDNQERSVFLLLGGFNCLDFLDYEDDLRANYSIGAFIQFKRSENISVIPFIVLSRKSSYIKNIKGEYSVYESDGLEYDQYIYKRYYDLNFEGSFVDIGLLVNFKFKPYKYSNIYFGFGLGYSIASNDYSSVARSIRTDELIHYRQNVDPFIEGYDVDLTFIEANSGFFLSANFMYNYKLLSVVPIYKIYLYNMSDMVDKADEIGAFHSFSILIGIGI
ncbi:MAG: hypothetical protein JXR46_10500 [Calditrichaceae bacterium]|nr:hypothetical protein [Calditrichaceae bacterium]MBN2709465.1 hypothetical protein [Calditrichaceae bacterium]RQV94061.1 MAG: hypothetical protein EH224_11130 [Calditrichota bacterium]